MTCSSCCGIGAHDLLDEPEKVDRCVRVGQLVSDLARRHFERSVEIDDAVALVVVRVSHGSSRAQWQRHLRALKGLDGSLFVDAQDDGVSGRIQVQPDYVLHLRGELRISAHLVGPHQMRLEPVLSKKIGDAAAGQADLLTEQPRGPAASAGWRRRHGKLNDSLDRLTRHGVILTPRLRAGCEARNAFRSEPRPDPRDLLARKIQPHRDLRSSDALGAEQHHACPPHEASRRGWTRYDLLKFAALLRPDLHRDGSSHDARGEPLPW